MSDETVEKKTRAPINALKIINALRVEKGLPKVGAKPIKVKLTKEAKEELFRVVVQELYPEAFTAEDLDFTEKMTKTAIAEFEKRVAEVQGETAPRAPYTGKPRGRKPKV